MIRRAVCRALAIEIGLPMFDPIVIGCQLDLVRLAEGLTGIVTARDPR